MPISWWQLLCFIIGISVLIAVLLPPIDTWSDRLFFVHMIQHLAISHLGVPLAIFGVPFVIVLRGLPYWFKKSFYFPLLRQRMLMACFSWISSPLVSLLLYMFNYLFWHIPVFYNLALLNDYWHVLSHSSIALTSILLWRNMIDPKPVRSHVPLPARLLFLAMLMASEIVLSAFLTYAKQPLYAYQGITQPSWWTWGHLQDQQLGGLLMWVGGGFLQFIAMTICFFVWVHRSQNESITKPIHMAT